MYEKAITVYFELLSPEILKDTILSLHVSQYNHILCYYCSPLLFPSFIPWKLKLQSPSIDSHLSILHVYRNKDSWDLQYTQWIYLSSYVTLIFMASKREVCRDYIVLYGFKHTRNDIIIPQSSTGQQRARSPTCKWNHWHLRVKPNAILCIADLSYHLTKASLWRFNLKDWKAKWPAGLCFTAPLKTCQAGPALHLILCCGVFVWVPASSRQTQTLRDRVVRDQSRRGTTAIPRHRSAEPRSSPPRAASWRCLEIAFKKAPPSNQTWAFWVCIHTRWGF